jgi:hypothetical protein
MATAVLYIMGVFGMGCLDGDRPRGRVMAWNIGLDFGG